MKKDLTWVQVIDSFKGKGCPLCILTKASTDRYLDFLYETVNEVGTREELRRSGGLCNAHAWQLTDYEVGKLTVAIVYEDLVGRAAENLDRHNPIGVPPESGGLRSILRKDERICPACGIAQESEKRYSENFIHNLDDEEFFREYVASAGFCLSHLARVLGKITDDTLAERLTELERDKLSSLKGELGEFVRKQDRTFSAAAYGPERDSWRRAIEKLVGKREVF